MRLYKSLGSTAANATLLWQLEPADLEERGKRIRLCCWVSCLRAGDNASVHEAWTTRGRASSMPSLPRRDLGILATESRLSSPSHEGLSGLPQSLETLKARASLLMGAAIGTLRALAVEARQSRGLPVLRLRCGRGWAGDRARVGLDGQAASVRALLCTCEALVELTRAAGSTLKRIV